MAYRILIVDDDREIVSMLKERLQMEGYDTAIAYDGEEGLEKIQQTNPDVILLDLILPKMNGFEVLKELREKFKDKWRPVIILSGKNDIESVKKGYSMEADHYLTKPCSMENILRAVRTMISLIPLRKQ
ncbi:MAG: response regulator [Candidatus Omnitrophica bacterium]|nr:response regulator [Candidatus Omnitrophota bacterium]